MRISKDSGVVEDEEKRTAVKGESISIPYQIVLLFTVYIRSRSLVHANPVIFIKVHLTCALGDLRIDASLFVVLLSLSLFMREI